MKLYGNFISPYVRRVAITMNLLGLPYEMETFMVFAEPEKVAALNPLRRIPTLVLDDGEVLIESAAILDALDEMAGPHKALFPASGEARRRVMKLVAVAVGAMEKAQAAFYETRFHPEEKVHQPWIEHNERQVLDALAFLDEVAQQAGDGWLDGGARMSQADVNAAVALTFVGALRPHLDVEKAFPALAAFTGRLEETEAFKAAPLPSA